MRSTLGFILALTAGCSVNVIYPVGLACDDGICPAGQSCVSKICVVGSQDAAQTPNDAAAPDAAVSTRTCGGSAAFASEFSSPQSAWMFDGATVIADGRLELEVADSEDSTFASTGPRLDLVDSHFFVEMAPSSVGVTTVGVKGDEGGVLTIRHEQNLLTFDVDYDAATSAAYSPVNHRFVGFRESGGSVLFQTSPDGIAFTTHRTIETPGFVQHFQGFFGAEGLGARASFDNLNTSSSGDTSDQTFCLATEFSDDFNIDGALSRANWSQFASCASVENIGGEVRFVASNGAFCVLATTNLHDLRGSEFVLELGSVFSGYFKYAIAGRGGELSVERFDTELRVSECVSGLCSLPDIVPYNGERFWRFSGSADGELGFAFSADGDAFINVSSVNSIDLSATKARFHGNPGTENRANAFN